MNCERCKNELEDFLYDELGHSRAAEVRAHLADCAVCAALRDEIEHEHEIFGRFYEQTSIEPAAEMWEAIHARINSEARERAQIDRGAWSPAFRPPDSGGLKAGLQALFRRARAGAFGRLLAPATLRQAAFAALLVALSVAATTIYLKLWDKGEKNVAIKGEEAAPTRPPQQGVTPTPAPSVDVARDGGKPNTGASAPKGVKPPVDRAAPPRQLTDQELMNRQIARAEREYQKAIRLLDQAITKQRDRLDPALIKQYESSLASIDNSIDASRRAFRERPDDPIAGQFLLAAYARKLDLMQDIAMK
ncbi:MAG TPA: zf-HC2 domain-containing protein [Blastocatellia bacterium]|nr:zf-HC2 domain-containing protein [Blastocatellia bacterium]